MDFGWDDMKLSYTYKEEGVAADAVAQLMRYCGQAVKMDYGLDGSSAMLNPVVMKETFDYSETTTMVYRNDYDAEAEAGADLVLSGHTHGGQMLPINRIGEWIGANDFTYGYERIDSTDFIVTSGISDWAIDFKTGCRSEYVVIEING